MQCIQLFYTPGDPFVSHLGHAQVQVAPLGAHVHESHVAPSGLVALHQQRLPLLQEDLDLGLVRLRNLGEEAVPGLDVVLVRDGGVRACFVSESVSVLVPEEGASGAAAAARAGKQQRAKRATSRNISVIKGGEATKTSRPSIGIGR